jgi:hypothetical protein
MNAPIAKCSGHTYGREAPGVCLDCGESKPACLACGALRSRFDPHLVFATSIVATVDGATGARVGLRACSECRSVFTEDLPE